MDSRTKPQLSPKDLAVIAMFLGIQGGRWLLLLAKFFLTYKASYIFSSIGFQVAQLLFFIPLHLAAGFGIYTLKPWARKLTITVAILKGTMSGLGAVAFIIAIAAGQSFSEREVEAIGTSIVEVVAYSYIVWHLRRPTIRGRFSPTLRKS